MRLKLVPKHSGARPIAWSNINSERLACDLRNPAPAGGFSRVAARVRPLVTGVPRKTPLSTERAFKGGAFQNREETSAALCRLLFFADVPLMSSRCGCAPGGLIGQPFSCGLRYC
jgi:hypothetical protein